MIGFKVMTKDGLRGPFQKSSILKAIETGVVPLKAKLLDLHSNKMVLAADLVGVELDGNAANVPPPGARAEASPKLPPKPAKAAKGPAVKMPSGIKPAKLPLKPKTLPGKKDKPEKPREDFHDTTIVAPVDGVINSGRVGSSGGATAVEEDDLATSEIGQLSHLSDLIITETEEPAPKKKKKKG